MKLRESIARLWGTFRPLRTDADLEAELRAHLELAAEHRGAPQSATGLTQTIESLRDQRGLPWLTDLGRDLRYAGRMLMSNPGFSVAVILTFAVGIGANTAVFSLINGLLLRRLPVPNPERLVLVSDPSRGSDLPPGVPNQAPFMWSYRLWEQIRLRPNLFESTCGYFYSRFDLASGGETDFADGLYVSGGFFHTFGVSMTIGRALTDADDQRDAAASGVAVIGHDFWRRRFGGTADVIGRTLKAERLSFTIVGVLPPGFVGPAANRGIDIVVPMSMAAEIRGPQFFEGAGVNWITITARLRPGQTVQAAEAELRGIQPQIREASLAPGPARRDDSYLKNPLRLLPADRGNLLDPLRVRARRPLLTMQMVVVLVLLIACMNVANLTLARATARRHEMSLRLVLGASPWRIARQLFAESLLLVLMGSVGAMLFAQWGVRILVRLFATGSNALTLDLAPDARVLTFTTSIAVVTAIATTIHPSKRATSIQPIDALKEQNANVMGARTAFASGFVIAQIALSIILVVGGGLLIRTYANLATMDLGFDSGGVLIADVGTRKAHIPPAGRLATFERVREAAEAVPGVLSAAMADVSPVTGGASAGDVEVPGRPSEGSKQTFVNRITPGWLSLYRTSILKGRDFGDGDRPGSVSVAIVNQAFVRKFFGGTDPIGHVVRQAQGPPGRPPMEWTVIGVTADAVYDSLRAAVPPTMYWPFGQINEDLQAIGATPASASLSVRVSGRDPLARSRSIAAAIANVNPELDLTFRSLPALVSGSLAIERTLALLSAFFGGLSLLLAAIGLYGVTSYEVTRRRREIGIRMALGATRKRVVREVLSPVLALVGLGIGIGVGTSLWASQFVTALLYGLPSRDPMTLVSAVLVLTGVGLLAGWLPARRASQLDPLVALRRE